MSSALPSSVIQAGAPLDQASHALVLIHGRGASAEGMLRLTRSLPVEGLALLAPQAPMGTWYPQRFLAPIEANEPYLSQALAEVENVIQLLEAKGISADKIGLIGFSQGACLVLEHLWRQPRRYGFAAALSGALIGPLDTARHLVDLQKTPVLLGCAEKDAHIPIEHVQHTAMLLGIAEADLTKFIFPGDAHTVFPQELEWLHKNISLLKG